MSLACRSIGLPGTAAILAGYYLHLDPYGHLHWSSPDALVGLAAAVPIALGGENPPRLHRDKPHFCMHICCSFDDPAYVLSHGNVPLDECQQ